MAMWASRTYVHRERRSLIDRFRDLYIKLLGPVLRFNPIVAGAVLAAGGLCFFLLHIAPSNLDPAANGLDVNIFATGPNGSSINYMLDQAAAMRKVLSATLPGTAEWLDASEQNHAVFGGYSFDTPEEAAAAVAKLTPALGAMPGLSSYVAQDNGLPGSDDLPVSVNISGQTNAVRLLNLGNKIQAQAQATGDFQYVQINPGQPQYQYSLDINRPLAAQLGISDADIGQYVSAALSGGILGQVSVNGTSMNIVTGSPPEGGADMLNALPIKTRVRRAGAARHRGDAARRRKTQRARLLAGAARASNIQAQQSLGVPLSKALADLRTAFNAAGAHDLSFGYSGPSETYQEANQQNARLFELGLAGLFFFAGGTVSEPARPVRRHHHRAAGQPGAADFVCRRRRHAESGDGNRPCSPSGD